MIIFSYFMTWLGFLGLLGGILVAALLDLSLLRSAIGGLFAGIVLVVIINTVSANPAPCLQQAKGLDILRAYSLACPDTSTAQPK